VTNSKIIVLWGDEDLLSTYLKQLLSSQKGWKVVSLPGETKAKEVLTIVAEIKPNFVIVVIQPEESPSDNGAAAKLLENDPNLQILTLNLNNNLMEVYSKKNVLINSSEDLISVIQAN